MRLQKGAWDAGPLPEYAGEQWSRCSPRDSWKFQNIQAPKVEQPLNLSSRFRYLSTRNQESIVEPEQVGARGWGCPVWGFGEPENDWQKPTHAKDRLEQS